ncbi:hypothetical protein LINPERHAP1_LOCUS24874 [Linum perenne]
MTSPPPDLSRLLPSPRSFPGECQTTSNNDKHFSNVMSICFPDQSRSQLNCSCKHDSIKLFSEGLLRSEKPELRYDLQFFPSVYAGCSFVQSLSPLR